MEISSMPPSYSLFLFMYSSLQPTAAGQAPSLLLFYLPLPSQSLSNYHSSASDSRTIRCSRADDPCRPHERVNGRRLGYYQRGNMRGVRGGLGSVFFLCYVAVKEDEEVLGPDGWMDV
ncbi:hypothetical protein GOODEAATRI_018649 [Goodea atripinnis]|uniref:Uncharacterized protein n=1 Tax=Goodea atripinnis TaxID=208336 RepID=A0ABV0MT80_9TELE